MMKRIVWYGIVGASGVIVNMVILTIARWLLPHLPTVTYLFAVEASIIWNYVLNAKYTFKNPFSWKGLWQYNLVSAAGALIQTAIYSYLLNTQHWYYLIADLVAIPFATGFGFLFSSIWVFRTREDRHEADAERPSPEPNPQGSQGNS